jgi:hypothetical protein
MAKAEFKIDNEGTATVFYEHTSQQAAQQDHWKNNGVVRDDVRTHNQDSDVKIEWSSTNFWDR